MNHELQNLAAKLVAFAEAENCVETTAFLHAMQLPGKKFALVNHTDDSQMLDALRSLVDGDWSDATEESGGAAFWLADHVVTAFPCGAMATANVLEAMAAGAFQRPPETTTLLLTSAEQITSVEDLQLVEAAAHRWLLPVDSSADGEASIASSGGFLWSHSQKQSPKYGKRIEGDKRSFIDRLKNTMPADVLHSLNTKRLAFAISLARKELVTNSDTTGHSANEILHQLTELETLSDRVRKRIRLDIDLLESGVRVAINGLAQDLNAEFPRFVNDQNEALSDTLKRDAAIESFFENVCDRWLTQPQNVFRQWSKSLDELAQLIQSTDAWEKVNRLNNSVDFPAQILNHLPNNRAEFASPQTKIKPTGESHSNSLAGILTGLAAGALGASLGIVSGYGAVAIAAGAGAGILGDSLRRRYSDRASRQAAMAQVVQQEIARIVKETRTNLMSDVTQRTNDLRGNVADGFNTAVSILDAELRNNSQQAKQSANFKKLIELQQRVAAVASTK